MAAISLFSTQKSVSADGPATGAAAPDGAAGFAAMMAGAGHPAASGVAATKDAGNAKGGKDVNGAQDTKNSSDAKDADADQHDLDDVRDADKGQRDDHRPQDDSVASAMALFGLVVPQLVRTDDRSEAAVGGQVAGQAGDASPAVSVAAAGRPPRGSDLAGDGKADALSVKDSDAGALASMLAALTDALAKGTAVRRADTAASTTGKTGFPVSPRDADDQRAAPAKGAGAVPLNTDGTDLITANPAQTAQTVETAQTVPTGQTALSPTSGATASIGKTGIALPTSPPVPVTATVPATATLMAARAAITSPDVANAEARKPAGDARTEGERGRDADVATDSSPSPVAATSIAAALPATLDHIASASASVIDGAGQQLAAATTDRQLDLARQGAWLDGVAHDIAAAGASSGTVRFEVAPQHLGTVGVELKRDDSGAAVTLTTGSEAARSILTDATPQLLAEARAHGLHIASAQVDVGSGNAGSGGNPSADSQGRSSGGQADGRHAASQNSGFSTQAGMGSETGRQSQTRSQLLPEYRSGSARTDRGSVGEAKASVAASSVDPSDARYA